MTQLKFKKTKQKKTTIIYPVLHNYKIRKLKNWYSINIQDIHDNSKPLSAIPCNDIIAC